MTVRASESTDQTSATGLLILAGTPIGDRRDASPRLIEVLTSADVIAAEDTRQFRQLLTRLQVRVSGRIVSYFEGNESSRTADLIADLQRGATVVLVTDAGMPSVSDPGYTLVRAALAAEITVTVVPGPSAVTTALAVSGLPVDRFSFEGFLPRKAGPRRRRLAELITDPRTLVFFEAPHRLADFLDDAAATLGAERPAAICRELTKPHEEVIRGTLSELALWAAGGVRGEVTMVISGAAEQDTDPADALDLVAARMAEGVSMSQAVTEVAALTGTVRKQLYQAVLAARPPSSRTPASRTSASRTSADRHSSVSNPEGPS